uniref:Uncharacterized protein n=1 Tax=Timema monikensis TaxID=170555 RepID=A0A7R9HUF4_9NEOP|nr:unnamed protein product [Timema monikensis]
MRHFRQELPQRRFKLMFDTLENTQGHNTRPLNVILSWKFWIPLSRLSYCVYIVHFYVFIVRTGSMKGPKRFDGFDHFVDFMGSYMLSTMFAVALYLGIEQPFSNLANAIPWKVQWNLTNSNFRNSKSSLIRIFRQVPLSPNGMANFNIKDDNLLSAGTVLQKPGDISLPDPSQGRNNEKRLKRDWPSSLILNVAQEMV